ncbi:MAG: phospholipid carrier-dependent glycosyltransferase, partial [Chloroflexi bacterium]|nr:phospholipid carrier-dependent glycosyltransferase [Chloroflexota bacterium]
MMSVISNLLALLERWGTRPERRPGLAARWHSWIAARRAPTVGLSLLVAAFALLRLVYLTADPPLGITTSRVFYTDEGWYARNAVAWVLTGHWHREGDFNPAVNIPVWTILQAAMFRLFGVSLYTARLLTVAFFVALLVLFYEFAAHYVPRWAALVGCLLLATNYRLFAYSRLALLEVPMMAFLMASLLMAARARRGHWRLGVALSAGAFACAYLTKTTAVIGLPAVVYLLWLASDGLGNKLKGLALWATVLLLILYVHYVTVALPHYPDYVYFNRLNIAGRQFDEWRPLAVLQHVAQVVWLGLTLYDPLLTGVVMGVTLLLLSSRQFRQCPAVRVALLGGGAMMAVMLTVTYHPTRYFLPLGVPLALLAAAALSHLHNARGGWLLRPVFAILLVSVLAVQGHAILDYLARPEYSFVEMCAQVRQQLAEEER